MTARMAPIRDFAVGIFDGPHATPEASDEGPVFLGIKNVTPDGRLDLSEIRHVSPKQYPQWTRRVTPQEDDIVFSYEATLHLYARIPNGFEGCLGRRMALIRPDREKVCPAFLLYYFLSPAWRAKMNAITITGATVNRIPLTNFPDTPVTFPSLPQQVAIADILCAYDDLIENNRKRIALLEEAARLLYREWFVHLRFPGHEHVKVVDGVPAGWERHSVSELATVHRGKSYSSEELVESDGQPFVNLKCINRFGGFRLSGLKGFRGVHKDHHLIAPGDIVIAVTDMTREAMIVAQAARIPRALGDNAIYSMDLVKAVPAHGVEPEWLYGLLRFSSFSMEVREKATGATVLHLQPKHIESWIATVPTARLRALFAENLCDLLSQIDNLELQNKKLEEARNLLLPRLMSGEIAV